MTNLRAGAASLALCPPLGLPMAGFVRQSSAARGYGSPLEVGAIALATDDARVVLCGVDIVGISQPEAAELVARVAQATNTSEEAVLLNWSHTHLAPIASQLHDGLYGDPNELDWRSVDAYAQVVRDKIVSACELAVERLEPARIVWGQTEVDLAVNRRERTNDGSRIQSVLGWNPTELVDNQVTVLQIRRPDESVLATLVNYGCHPVTIGYDTFIYSADFPGPMRDLVRQVTRGECVFFQGAAGNVLPRFAFTEGEAEAEWFGRRLAVAALDSVIDRFSRPCRVVTERDASVTPITMYRRVFAEGIVDLAAISREIAIPLMPHPTVEDLVRLREEYEAGVAEARRSGDRGAIKVAHYHATWARKIEQQLRDGTAPTAVRASVHAVRIGEGAIVTSPGEAFTEFGMAVKERSPATPTMYAGYTNDYVGYLPTAREYAYGGYEAGYGYKTVGLPSLFQPVVEVLCVETAVRLLHVLFPEQGVRVTPAGWEATGALPKLDRPRFDHPSTAATT